MYAPEVNTSNAKSTYKNSIKFSSEEEQALKEVHAEIREEFDDFHVSFQRFRRFCLDEHITPKMAEVGFYNLASHGVGDDGFTGFNTSWGGFQVFARQERDSGLQPAFEDSLVISVV